jgi:hypothetical protein
MGVHGVCSNDPRLFAQAEKIAAGAPASDPQPSKREAKKAKKATKAKG